MKKLKVLVTGGAGFLGSHLCERLLKLGRQVVCVDNYLTGSKKNVSHLLSNSDFHIVVYVHISNPQRDARAGSVLVNGAGRKRKQKLK